MAVCQAVEDLREYHEDIEEEWYDAAEGRSPLSSSLGALDTPISGAELRAISVEVLSERLSAGEVWA